MLYTIFIYYLIAIYPTFLVICLFKKISTKISKDICIRYSFAELQKFTWIKNADKNQVAMQKSVAFLESETTKEYVCV